MLYLLMVYAMVATVMFAGAGVLVLGLLVWKKIQDYTEARQIMQRNVVSSM